MAIRTVVTRGYGNGTFDGTIALVVTRGFLPAVVVVAPPALIRITTADSDVGFVRLRRLLQGSALVVVSVETEAAGKLNAIGSAEAVVVPVAQMGGIARGLDRGVATLHAMFESKAQGRLIENMEADDWEVLYLANVT